MSDGYAEALAPRPSKPRASKRTKDGVCAASAFDVSTEPDARQSLWDNVHIVLAQVLQEAQRHDELVDHHAACLLSATSPESRAFHASAAQWNQRIADTVHAQCQRLERMLAVLDPMGQQIQGGAQ